MNLEGGNKKSEEPQLINISVVSTAEEHIKKSVRAYAMNSLAVQQEQFLERL